MLFCDNKMLFRNNIGLLLYICYSDSFDSRLCFRNFKRSIA